MCRGGGRAGESQVGPETTQKARGGHPAPGFPSLPPSLPPRAAESPPPGSCGPSPGGAGGAAGARPGPRETSAGSGGPCPAGEPDSLPCGGPGGEASGVWRARKRPGTSGEAAGAGRRGGGGGGRTSQLSPRASLARQPGAPFPRRRSEPCPQRQSLNESETRGCRRRAGTGGGRGGGAPRSGWSWEDAAAAAATSPENTRRERDAEAAGTGRDQVAVEISSGGERAFGAKCGCERSARGITVPGTEAERPSAGRPRGRRELDGRPGGTEELPPASVRKT